MSKISKAYIFPNIRENGIKYIEKQYPNDVPGMNRYLTSVFSFFGKKETFRGIKITHNLVVECMKVDS